MNTRNTIITAVLTSMLTSILTFFGLDYLKSRRWSEEDKTEVPLILGLTQAQAESVLRQQGLKLTILERKPNADFSANTVCVQSPPKGKSVPKGSVVTAVISTGQPKAKVPPIIGKPLTSATRLLTQAGFKVGPITKKKHPSLPKDQVMAATPAPGATAKKGATIRLTLSEGVGEIEVPKIRGKYYNSGKKAIIEAGFVVGEVKWRDDLDHDSYIILRQEPKAETKAPKGSKINIWVNRGD